MKYFLAILFACLTTPSYGEVLSFDQIKQAVCRVSADSGRVNEDGQALMMRGSGIVFSEKNKKLFVLTNAHVVGSATKVSLDFFDDYQFRERVTGKVEWKARKFNFSEGVDFAIISVNISDFDKKPRIIPFVNKDYKFSVNTRIHSVGLPHGRWPMSWRGKIKGSRGNVLQFTPNPFAGQSGSGILVIVPDEHGKKHTKIGALLTLRSRNTFFTREGRLIGTGGACYISTLYKLLGE